jgi:hypothetical protein
MVYLMVPTTWITVVILELIHAGRPDFGRVVFIRAELFSPSSFPPTTHNPPPSRKPREI